MSPQRCPIEIWDAILRLSVEIPGSLETKWDHPPDVFLWDGWEPQYSYMPRREKDPAYCLALKMKISIVHVSRTWREIGVGLLYEHLIFCGNERRVVSRDGKEDEDEDEDEEDEDEEEEEEEEEDVFPALGKVSAIFERHADEYGYGKATKRIDVDVAATHPAYIATLIRLLNLCHNLRVFAVFNTGPGGHRGPACRSADLIQLASLLQTRFCHSLRRMTFHLDDRDMAEDSPPLQFHIHLPDLPLDSLEFGNYSTFPYTPPPAAMTTVSALTIQVALRSLGNMVSWHCPALRHVTLIKFNNEINISFIISHGPQLISLAINFSMLIGIPNISRLITPATNLRCLVYDFWGARSFSEQDIFPSITHVGIRLRPRQTLSGLPFAKSTFPNLQCLRFLDVPSNLERTNWLLYVARQFSPIRVEIKNYQLINLGETHERLH